MEPQETSVKYQFDIEMVQFVKQLEIKTAMFGYDKTDVYKKFKDLLVRARTFCDHAVEKEREKNDVLTKELEALKQAPESAAEGPASEGEADGSEGVAGSVAEAEGAPVEAAASVDREDGSDVGAGQDLETPEGDDALPRTDREEREAFLLEQIDALHEENNRLTEALEQRRAEQEEAEETLSDVRQALQSLESEHQTLLEEKEALAQKLLDYADKEDQLNHTGAILDEARLEGENIVREARVRGEQELFLYRARQREEERAHQERMASLLNEKKQLEQACQSYRAYISKGKTLLQDMKAYAEHFEAGNPSEASTESAPGGNELDPFGGTPTEN